MKELVRMQTYKNYVGELKAIYTRTDRPTVKIRSSKDIYDFITIDFDLIMDDHEEVKIIHLNNANEVVNVHHSTSGTDNGSLFDLKDILRKALLIKTSSIIMVHNHPSGTLWPSDADKNVTKKLKNAGDLIDIKLLDSIIITRESYYSFADEGIF